MGSVMEKPLGRKLSVGVLFAATAWMVPSAPVAFGQAAAAPQTAPGAQAAAAPQAPAAKLEFDVATVRPSAPLDVQKLTADMQAGKMPNFGVHINGSRAEYNYTTMKTLIASAFKVKEYQVTGPAWLATDHFDVVAKMPDGSTKDDAPAMLRSLLADRFKLAAHKETKEHPVLALVVGKGGPKMKESPGDAAPIDPDSPLKSGEIQMDTPDGPARMTIDMKNGGATINMGTKGTVTYSMDPQSMMMRIVSSKTTMAALADTLTQMMTAMGGGSGREVLDMTELKGNYEVALEFSLADMMAAARTQGVDVPGAPAGGAAAAEASDPGGGTSVSASVEKLGLKLESRKAPVEQVVVDSVEKTPTEN